MKFPFTRRKPYQTSVRGGSYYSYPIIAGDVHVYTYGTDTLTRSLGFRLYSGLR